MEMGNDTNKLAADCRALIESLPEKFHQALTHMVEKVSGEPIREFDEEVAERMFGWNCYKKYFKLYVMSFILETMVLETITDGVDITPMLKKIQAIFGDVDNIPEDQSMTDKIKSLMSFGTNVITLVSAITKLNATHFEEPTPIKK